MTPKRQHWRTPRVAKTSENDTTEVVPRRTVNCDLSSKATMTTEEGETYYRIRVAPNELSVGRGGNLHQLIPGMVVQASIHTGEPLCPRNVSTS